MFGLEDGSDAGFGNDKDIKVSRQGLKDVHRQTHPAEQLDTAKEETEK